MRRTRRRTVSQNLIHRKMKIREKCSRLFKIVLLTFVLLTASLILIYRGLRGVSSSSSMEDSTSFNFMELYDMQRPIFSVMFLIHVFDHKRYSNLENFMFPELDSRSPYVDFLTFSSTLKVHKNEIDSLKASHFYIPQKRITATTKSKFLLNFLCENFYNLQFELYCKCDDDSFFHFDVLEEQLLLNFGINIKTNQDPAKIYKSKPYKELLYTGLFFKHSYEFNAAGGGLYCFSRELLRQLCRTRIFERVPANTQLLANEDVNFGWWAHFFSDVTPLSGVIPLHLCNILSGTSVGYYWSFDMKHFTLTDIITHHHYAKKDKYEYLSDMYSSNYKGNEVPSIYYTYDEMQDYKAKIRVVEGKCKKNIDCIRVMMEDFFECLGAKYFDPERFYKFLDDLPDQYVKYLRVFFHGGIYIGKDRHLQNDIDFLKIVKTMQDQEKNLFIIIDDSGNNIVAFGGSYYTVELFVMLSNLHYVDESLIENEVKYIRYLLNAIPISFRKRVFLIEGKKEIDEYLY